MKENGMRVIEDWERIEPSVAIYAIGEEPPEVWHWREIRIRDRIEAVEHMRRKQHGWKQGHEPRLERIARLVERS